MPAARFGYVICASQMPCTYGGSSYIRKWAANMFVLLKQDKTNKTNRWQHKPPRTSSRKGFLLKSYVHSKLIIHRIKTWKNFRSNGVKVLGNLVLPPGKKEPRQRAYSRSSQWWRTSLFLVASSFRGRLGFLCKNRYCRLI